MDIKNLNTLIHVAELGSFSRAGERLGYSQPTVSVQIKQLEEELREQMLTPGEGEHPQLFQELLKINLKHRQVNTV